jgi:protein SCO1/2
MRLNKIVFSVCLSIAFITSVATATESTLHGVQIEPPKPVSSFTLTDQNGNSAEFPAHAWQLVFFGFTSCPNVCPITLTKATQVYKRTGEDASKLKLTFVTVDPERDTSDVIKRFLASYDAPVQGVTGDMVQMQDVSKEFEIVTRRYQDNATASYRIEHSSFLYLLDPQGRVVMFYPATAEVNGVAGDIKYLLAR